MLAVLSPAKALDFSAPGVQPPPTSPALMSEAETLMKTTRRLTRAKIAELMSLSDDLARLNHQRFRGFELPFTADNARPAALAFNGDVYRGLAARELSVEDLQWAQDRISILSGLFGLLRPLDLIQPYRLEMGTRLATRRGKNLYDFWGDTVVQRINHMLHEHDDPTLVNLASAEYFKVVRVKALRGPLITCVFEDWKGKESDGGVISFLAKYARGLMARYIVDNRVDRAEGLKDFAVQRYKFRPGRSTPDRWVFGRKHRAGAG